MRHLFISDVHLGGHISKEKNIEVEERLIKWFDTVTTEGSNSVVIYLLGDIFDFWFEYKRVVPASYSRILSRLKELTSQGYIIHFFKGNHDMWLRNYLEKEIGLIIHHKSEIININGENIFVGHGHDICFKRTLTTRLLWIFFTNRLIFNSASTLIHPNLLVKLGWAWSGKSKKVKKNKPIFYEEDAYITKYIYSNHSEYSSNGVTKYIFGHFHTPTLYELKNNGSQLMILSDWSDDKIYYGEYCNGTITLIEF